MDIYQQIWNADQEGNGIQPVLHASQGDPDHGYVVVNEAIDASRDHRLFTELVISCS